MVAFTTLFNINFIPQGICLIESILRNVSNNPKVFVLCMDKDTYKILNLRFHNKITLISLSELMDDELLQIKKERKFNEFCWTLTPTLIRYVAEKFNPENEVFYCDADTVFLKPADEIFANFKNSNRSVYITEHGYDPIYDQTATSGRYCVQLIGFSNAWQNECLNYWEGECRKWCFDRFEDGNFGDQKYLEDFETQFPGEIYVEPSLSYFQAPWNCNYYRNSDAVFFHFHSLRMASNNYVHLGHYEINKYTYEYIYLPYIRKLLDITNRLKEAGIYIEPQILIRSYIFLNIYSILSAMWRKLKINLNLRKVR